MFRPTLPPVQSVVMRRASGGFSMVELVVAITIISILLALGVPSFSTWIQNRRIQTAAASIVDGMHLARAKAIERNTTVNFVLNTLPDTSWTVKCPTATTNCSLGDASRTSIEKASANEGTQGVNVAVANITMTSPPTFSFNGVGQLTAPTPPAAPLPVLTLTLPAAGACKSAGGPVTCLNIQVTASGKVRYCNPDPALPATSLNRC